LVLSARKVSTSADICKAPISLLTDAVLFELGATIWTAYAAGTT
jgi:hypothetical protein